ncbi:MAG: hypothetical protein PHQ40_17670 [Anaerolineaceae bacterium]|nr:hypothetical protein [Anaerolineaceae bacterium]
MSKIMLFMLLAISLMFPFSNLNPVHAQVKGLKSSNDHIQSEQVILDLMGVSDIVYESTGPFVYAPSVTVDRFRADEYRYEVVVGINKIVNFQPISDESF